MQKKKEKIQTSAKHSILSIIWNAGYGAGAAVIFLEKKLAQVFTLSTIKFD